MAQACSTLLPPRWCSAQIGSHCVLLQRTCCNKVQEGLAVPLLPALAVFSVR